MLFDINPKQDLKDFFNYETELNSLVGFLQDRNSKIIVIKGLRRTGKSSLVRVGLKKAGVKFVLIDVRELTSLSRKSFESKLLEELKSIKGIHEALLDRIESVDAGVRFSLRRSEGVWPLLKKLNPVIAVDEVQMLKGSGVEAFLAAVYDNTNCKILLTGSEVGVLDAFIGKENPKAPLFGRVYSEIKLHSLPPEKSREFLMLGFKQLGKNVPGKVFDEALTELDGIVGWLAMFGSLSFSIDPVFALKEAIVNGSKLAYSELESFLAMRPTARKRYLVLLKILAEKNAGWSELKLALEVRLNEKISDPQFTNYLNSLIDYGFLLHQEDRYILPDPLLKKSLTGGVSYL